MTTLRLAYPADAPALAVLAERSFRDTFGARNSPGNMDLHCAKSFGPEIQQREIGERGLVTTIAESDGQMIGYTQLRLLRAHPSVTAKQPAELNRIYVLAEWQGRGAAGHLMQRAIETATKARCDYLWLGVWEHNPKAMAFYKKFGLEVVGTQAFMLGEERQRDVVMGVKLG